MNAIHAHDIWWSALRDGWQWCTECTHRCPREVRDVYGHVLALERDCDVVMVNDCPAVRAREER